MASPAPAAQVAVEQTTPVTYRLERDGANVSVVLQPGQRIMARNGAMLWYDQGLKVQVRSGSMMSMFSRAFSGNDVLMTEFANEDATKTLEIALGSSLPMARIQAIELKPGDSFLADRACFVGCTPNVQVGGKVNLRGFVMNQGLFLSHFTVPKTATTAGTIWIAGFGGIHTYQVAAGEAKMVDTGLFLAAREEVTQQWELKTVGSIGGSMFNGEGLAISIPGPATLYLHSHSLRDFVGAITPYLPKK